MRGGRAYFSAPIIRQAMVPFVRAVIKDSSIDNVPDEYAAKLLPDEAFNLWNMLFESIFPLYERMFDAVVEEFEFVGTWPVSETIFAEDSEGQLSTLRFIQKEAQWAENEEKRSIFNEFDSKDYSLIFDAQKQVGDFSRRMLRKLKKTAQTDNFYVSKHLGGINIKRAQNAREVEKRMNHLFSIFVYAAFCGVDTDTKTYEANAAKKIRALTEFAEQHLGL